MRLNHMFALFLFGMSSLSYGITVGLVDMQQIILTVEEGKSARDALQQEIKAKETELQKQKEELDKMNEEWKSQASLLSEDARMRKQSEFQEKFMKLRNEEMQFQQAIKQKESEVTQKIALKVTDTVSKIAKEKSIDVVFETNSSGLMYAKDPVNLTEEIIKQYEKNYVPGSKISKK